MDYKIRAAHLLRTDLINMLRFKKGSFKSSLPATQLPSDIWAHMSASNNYWYYLFQRKKFPLTLQKSAQRSFPCSPEQLYLFERQWVLPYCKDSLVHRHTDSTKVPLWEDYESNGCQCFCSDWIFMFRWALPIFLLDTPNKVAALDKSGRIILLIDHQSISNK